MSAPKETPPTKLLYYDDAYLKEFDAEILKITRYDDRYGVVLDRSAFYPLGGGQPTTKELSKVSMERFVLLMFECKRAL